MTTILLILPTLQIALNILMDLRFDPFYKWIVLVSMIALGLIFANISWSYTAAQEGEICGTGKPIVLAFACMVPVVVHGIYLILKLLKDTFT